MKMLRILIIPLYVIPFFLGCNNDIVNNTIMNIEISEYGLNQSSSEYEICLYEVKKPFYSMRQFHKINCKFSDNRGVINFEVKKNGHYRIDISGNNGFYFTNDFIRIKDFQKIKIFDFIYSEDDVDVRLYFD